MGQPRSPRVDAVRVAQLTLNHSGKTERVSASRLELHINRMDRARTRNLTTLLLPAGAPSSDSQIRGSISLVQGGSSVKELFVRSLVKCSYVRTGSNKVYKDEGEHNQLAIRTRISD